MENFVSDEETTSSQKKGDKCLKGKVIRESRSMIFIRNKRKIKMELLARKKRLVILLFFKYLFVKIIGEKESIKQKD